jgi:hypothetical protein
MGGCWYPGPCALYSRGLGASAQQERLVFLNCLVAGPALVQPRALGRRYNRLYLLSDEPNDYDPRP